MNVFMQMLQNMGINVIGMSLTSVEYYGVNGWCVSIRHTYEEDPMISEEEVTSITLDDAIIALMHIMQARFTPRIR